MLLFSTSLVAALIALGRTAPLVGSIGSTSRPASIARRDSSIAGPVTKSNFPDPGVIPVDGNYYAFSTSSMGLHVPWASKAGAQTWTINSADALPSPGAWAEARDIWAPDVIQLTDGSFVMYYSAPPKGDPVLHCVGVATSKSVKGPYKAVDKPFACPVKQGGAIDASGYQDRVTGLRYVVYKVDGNAKGKGGDCGNSIEPIVSTPVLLQQVGLDGVTLIGDPMPILDRDDRDGPLVEAPSIYQSAEGIYFLFFSSGCYTSPSYEIKYATATDIAGPYTKASKPLLKSGDGPNLNGAGGASVSADGKVMIFHANLSPRGRPLYRGVFTAKPRFDGRTVTI
ncbi:hypothetical protein GJ744_000115 [Endocarpon pusillum]|uniref:Glycoside hydrolase family 43 protein n=1 Tax=Endocarpon pusillum TaxID=364733 RepID=A0A8H7EA95_9EURO|nr:hypothetical protein GJ744_000115 [Endocarpon pusillum]